MTEARRHERGFSRRPKILDLIGSGGTSEDEARDFAYGLVRHVRKDSDGRIFEGPAPDPETVKERRETRQSHDV